MPPASSTALALLVAGLAVGVVVLSGVLSTEESHNGLYTSLYGLRWPCDPPELVVMPLALPTSRWNSFGKVMGTATTTAVTYTVLAMNDNTGVLALDQTHQRCPAGATCHLSDRLHYNVVPELLLTGVMGRNSVVMVPVPAATDRFVVANLHGVVELRLQTPVQAAVVPRQLWRLEINNVPNLQRILRDTASGHSTWPIDVRDSLNAIRLTLNLEDPATVIATDALQPATVILGGDIPFVLTEATCSSHHALISVHDIDYVGRVGRPLACGPPPGEHLIVASGKVGVCVAMGSGTVLCTDCLLRDCLSQPL